MKLTNQTAVLFDLDGTLVDTVPDLVGALRTVMVNRGLEIDKITVAMFKNSCGHGVRLIIKRGYDLVGIKLTSGDLEDLVEEFLIGYQRRIAVQSRPFDGVAEILSQLFAKKIRLAVCTNKTERLARMLMEKLDLAHYFTTIIGGDTAERPKPAPNQIWLAAQRLGVKVKDCIMVGDTIIDQRASEAAGIPFIAVRNGKQIDFTGHPVTIDYFYSLPTVLGIDAVC